MAGFESIERISQQEMPDLLFARAVAPTGAVAAPAAHEHESPGNPGDFSFINGRPTVPAVLNMDMLSSPAVSAVGEGLPSLIDQQEHLEALRESELMGDLMRKVRLSRLTGCIMQPDVWRNHKGYPKVALKAAKELGIGSSREMHRVVHFLFEAESTGEAPTKEQLSQQVDHICRNPACCSPTHTRRMSNAENNSLKDEAAKVEPMIINGQLFYAEDILKRLPWLRDTIVNSGEDLPRRAISTRLGPFALRVACPDQSVVYGERLNCEVYDALRPPGRNTYVRPSRAKKPAPIKNQKSIFHQTKYSKKDLPTTKERYQAAIAGS
jgi:hypothetical protein